MIDTAPLGISKALQQIIEYDRNVCLMVHSCCRACSSRSILCGFMKALQDLSLEDAADLVSTDICVSVGQPH